MYQCGTAQVAAVGIRRHAATQNAKVLRPFNDTNRDEARAESYDVGLGTFRRPTEVTLVLSDNWEPLVTSLERWGQALAQH